MSRFSSLLNICIFDNTLTNQYRRSGKKQNQEIIQNYNFLILTTNTQEPVLPHKFFKAKLHIPVDDKEQLSLEYPDGRTSPERHWANWSPQHTPNTHTHGEIFEWHVPHIFLIWTPEVTLTQQRGRVKRRSSAYIWHAQEKELKEKLWKPQIKTIK